MHPVDEYAALKEQIKQLEARALDLRARFLAPNAPRRSNQYEVVVRHQTRRTFQKDRLPADILNDARYWEETSSPIVTVKSLTLQEKPSAYIAKAKSPQSHDFHLVEPF